MIKYKFTTQDLMTGGDKTTRWLVGEWKETTGEGDLCGPGWLHCYDYPLLAVLHNPIHGNYGDDSKLWEVEVDGNEKRDGQMKSGWTRMRLIQEIPVPKITTVHRVAYAILCAKCVYKEKRFTIWVDNWLNNIDRTGEAAWAATAAAWAAEAAEEAEVRADIDLIKIAKQSMLVK